MFSYIDLFLVLILALIFVLIFKIWQKLFSHYFSLTEVAVGVGISVSYLAIILKLTVLYLFGFISMIFINDIEIVMMGTAIGAFLIIWPNIINPTFFIISPDRKQVLLIYSLYLIFIASAILLSYFGSITFIKFKKQIIEAFFQDVFKSLIWVGVGAILTNLWKKISEILASNNIVENREDDYYEQ
jgi:hypothetical protein